MDLRLMMSIFSVKPIALAAFHRNTAIVEIVPRPTGIIFGAEIYRQRFTLSVISGHGRAAWVSSRRNFTEFGGRHRYNTIFIAPAFVIPIRDYQNTRNA